MSPNQSRIPIARPSIAVTLLRSQGWTFSASSDYESSLEVVLSDSSDSKNQTKSTGLRLGKGFHLQCNKTSGPTGGGAHMWIVCGELWNEAGWQWGF